MKCMFPFADIGAMGKSIGPSSGPFGRALEWFMFRAPPQLIVETTDIWLVSVSIGPANLQTAIADTERDQVPIRMSHSIK